MKSFFDYKNKNIMADFKKYAQKLRVLEGGFVNHPIDEGGPTNRGVTLRTYQNHFGPGKTVEDLRRISDKEWEHIMKTGYWDRCKADKIDSQAIAEIMVDWCVNSGMMGLRRVQELVGTRPDGIAGPITLSLINSSDPEMLFNRIKAARNQHYINIVRKSPMKRVFMNGWMNRLSQFEFEP